MAFPNKKGAGSLEALTSEDFDVLTELFDALAQFDAEDKKLAVEAAPSPSGSAASGASQK